MEKNIGGRQDTRRRGNYKNGNAGQVKSPSTTTAKPSFFQCKIKLLQIDDFVKRTNPVQYHNQQYFKLGLIHGKVTIEKKIEINRI